jgi:hypothetical protein
MRFSKSVNTSYSFNVYTRCLGRRQSSAVVKRISNSSSAPRLRIIKGKGVPVFFNRAPRHGGVLGSGGTLHAFFDLGTRWR